MSVLGCLLLFSREHYEEEELSSLRVISPRFRAKRATCFPWGWASFLLVRDSHSSHWVRGQVGRTNRICKASHLQKTIRMLASTQQTMNSSAKLLHLSFNLNRKEIEKKQSVCVCSAVRNTKPEKSGGAPSTELKLPKLLNSRRPKTLLS